MNATKTLWQEIEAGERQVVVSLCLGGVENEYQECSVEEAKTLLRKRMAPRWHYVLPDWQWSEEDGVLRNLDEINEVRRNLGCDEI